MGMISEFKEFAMKGNLIDMATGIIVGIASGKLVSSLVNDIIMPPIGIALGGADFSKLGTELQAAAGDIPAVMLKWGAFIQSFIDFLIIMLVVFIIIKVATRNKKEEVEEEKGPSQEDLLTDIRDLLKK
ncbi:MAG: large-conductance mechanosensitive channel protein MscL [Thiotrichaceae bacterium]